MGYYGEVDYGINRKPIQIPFRCPTCGGRATAPLNSLTCLGLQFMPHDPEPMDVVNTGDGPDTIGLVTR